jgi:hypothetical protein
MAGELSVTLYGQARAKGPGVADRSPSPVAIRVTLGTMSGSWAWPPGWRKIRAEVFRVKGRQCWHCGRPAATADHYPVPAALGGPSTLANLVPCCQPCYSSRGASFGNRRRPRRPLSPRQLAAIRAKRAGAGRPAPAPRSSRDW